jgi:hypothetical protein
MSGQELGGLAAHGAHAAAQQDGGSGQGTSGRSGEWYADPFGTAAERWWDGKSWTDEVRGAPETASAEPHGADAERQRGDEGATQEHLGGERIGGLLEAAAAPAVKADTRAETQVYCTECGTELRAARFCPQCGVATANAAAPAAGGVGGADAPTRLVAPEVEPTVTRTTPRVPDHQAARPASPPPDPVSIPPGTAGRELTPATAHAPQKHGTTRRRPTLLVVVAGCVLAAVAMVAAIVLLSGRSGPAYATEARSALAPVVQENNQLAGALGSLSARGGSSEATTAVQGTIAAVEAAQRTLATLAPGSGDQPFAGNARAAMASELAWLNAAASVLSNPGSPMLSQLGSLGVDTQTKLAAISAEVPGAAASFPGSSRLIAYAQARTSAAGTKTALTKYSTQVQSLLTQSAPAFEQINQLFEQMQTAANGGVADITLAQAEATINTVVANRTSLAASARTLNAPTRLAGTVTAALVAAFDTSLNDDQDISNCLNQANSGTFAIIFEGCLTSTGSAAGTATAAKQHFLSLYNQLRRQVGEPATSQQF